MTQINKATTGFPPAAAVPGLTAAAVANVPAGNIAAATVQAALNELDTEKVAKDGATMTGPLVVDSTHVAIGTNPATTGVLRIPNNSWCYARNAANNADVPLFLLTSSNKTSLNSGVQVDLSIGTTPKFSVAASLNTSVNDIAIGTNPASTGAVRLPNNSIVYFRNAANNADLFGIGVLTDNKLYVGNSGLAGVSVGTIVNIDPVGKTVTLSDATNLVVNATTGTKIGTAASQKLGFWNATPDVQPTTAITGATFTEVSGTAVNTGSTFDGYTIAQVVAALRRIGVLA